MLVVLLQPHIVSGEPYDLPGLTKSLHLFLYPFTPISYPVNLVTEFKRPHAFGSNALLCFIFFFALGFCGYIHDYFFKGEGEGGLAITASGPPQPLTPPKRVTPRGPANKRLGAASCLQHHSPRPGVMRIQSRQYQASDRPRLIGDR